MELYKKMAFLLSLGIMCIGMLTFSTTKPSIVSAETTDGNISSGENTDNNGETAKSNIAATNTPTPTSTPTPTPIPPNDLTDNTEVTDLITRYLQAKLSCESKEFEELVTDPSLIDIETLMLETEYIKEYQIVDCKTKWIDDEFDYVAYVTYNLVFPVIDTPAPSFDIFFVKKTENGLRIYNDKRYEDFSPETIATLDEYDRDPEVIKINEDVDARMTEAIDADPELAEFFNRINEFIESKGELELGD